MEKHSTTKEQFRKDILEYSPGGMYVYRLSEPTHYLFKSFGFCRMLGSSFNDEDQYEKDIELKNIYAEDRKKFKEYIKRMQKGPCKGSCVYRVVKQDGSLLHVLDTMEVKMCDDEVLRGYSSITDISMQVRLQEEYRNQLKKEQEAARRFATLIKFSKVLFFELDTRSYKYTNSYNLFDVMGYHEFELREILRQRKIHPNEDSEVLGDLYFLLHPSEKERAHLAAEELRKNKGFHNDYRFLCGDGLYHWFEVEMKESDFDSHVKIGYMRNADERRKKLEKLRLKAVTDPMTGLLNKIGGMKEINEYICLHPEELSAFLFLDVDDFKQVNDQLGHDMGDRIIMYVADTLRNVFREDDILVRFGGDEYIIFMKNIKTKEDVYKRIAEINPLCSTCDLLRDSDLKLTCSIGVSFTSETKSIKDLFLEADDYVYLAKQNRKGVAVTESGIVD